MGKTRFFSTKHDFSTGFIAKICIILGVFLFIIFGISSLLSERSFGAESIIAGMISIGGNELIPAFGIIFLGVGVIVWFLHRQFLKLAQIADEIEQINGEE